MSGKKKDPVHLSTVDNLPPHLRAQFDEKTGCDRCPSGSPDAGIVDEGGNLIVVCMECALAHALAVSGVSRPKQPPP